LALFFRSNAFASRACPAAPPEFTPFEQMRCGRLLHPTDRILLGCCISLEFDFTGEKSRSCPRFQGLFRLRYSFFLGCLGPTPIIKDKKVIMLPAGEKDAATVVIRRIKS
jgi:hypothetical protein